MRRFLLLVLVVAAGLYLVWYQETKWPVRRADEPPQSLVVEPGTGVLEIGRQLQGLGLVPHSQIFRLLVASKRAGGRLRAGEYALEGEMSLDQIVDKIVRGDVVHHIVTFPEGTDMEEMSRIVATQGIPPAAFLQAARDASGVQDLDPDAKDLEGYLFPDTYEVEPRRPDAAAALVKRMLHRFRVVLAPMAEEIRQGGLTVREVVTLASLVELETARKEERPHIASVFLNRLKRHVPLQTDPTVIYALRRAGTWDGNIHKEDLDVVSPYNTYRVAGLPPGPIASPGREAIRAVVEPMPSDDLYFVSRNDGSHQFSRTLAEHQRAVDLYQRHRHLELAGASASPSPLPSPGPSASAAPSAPPTRPPGSRR